MKTPQHFVNYTLRIPVATYGKLQQLAQQEKRSVANVMYLSFDRILQQLLHEDVTHDQARDHANP